MQWFGNSAYGITQAKAWIDAFLEYPIGGIDN
jgi:hypothetical protein